MAKRTYKRTVQRKKSGRKSYDHKKNSKQSEAKRHLKNAKLYVQHYLKVKGENLESEE